MSFLREIATQVQIWTTYERLNRSERQVRMNAVETLRAIGPSSLACLRYAANPMRPAKMRLAAAVGLHHLGDPLGLRLLREALTTLPPLESDDLAAEIEAAFVAVGAPDAVTALIEIFPLLDPAHVTMRVRCACSALVALRDPRGLLVFVSYADAFPELFEKSVPAFGEMAVLHLERMAQDASPARRRLAVTTLKRIAGRNSFHVLARLLRDSDLSVRSIVPAALHCVDAISAPSEIEQAVREGYSSREAIESISPRASELLLSVLLRWNKKSAAPTQDSPDALLAVLSRLAACDIATETLIAPLCRLIQTEPNAEIATAAAQTLLARLPVAPPLEADVRDALATGLSSPDAPLREACCEGLSKLNDPIGREMQQLLTACWPQESLISRLQSLLKGGKEANQIAAQTMQQFSSWLIRVSRDTLDRLASPLPDTPFALSAERSARLLALLRELLRRSLTAFQQSKEMAITSERLALCIAAVRAIGRLGAQAVASARPELICALNTVKSTALPDYPLPVYREIGEFLRETAALQLLEFSPAECFDLFHEALQASQTEVRQTAIRALGRLGDPRALPALQQIATDATHPNTVSALEAIAAIRKLNPDYMTLLRASEAKITGDTLLRPAQGNLQPAQSDHLLRSSLATPESSSVPLLSDRGGIP